MVRSGSNTTDVSNLTEQAASVPSCPHVTRPVCLDIRFGSKAGPPGTSPAQLNLQGPQSREKPGTGLHHSTTAEQAMDMWFLQKVARHTHLHPSQCWGDPGSLGPGLPEIHKHTSTTSTPGGGGVPPMGPPSEEDLADGSQACDMEASPASCWLTQQHLKGSPAAWGNACKLAFPRDACQASLASKNLAFDPEPPCVWDSL